MKYVVTVAGDEVSPTSTDPTDRPDAGGNSSGGSVAGPSVLYLTYTGILDPLGLNQILPYLIGTRGDMSALSIVSFEKRKRLEAIGESKKRELEALGIQWRQLTFTEGKGRLGRAWDLARMYARVLVETLRTRVQVIHCRGYNTAQVGLLLKRIFGTRLIFDMRSFWADQRFDGGLWDQRKSFDRWLYAYYKRLEKRLIDNCDRLVVLTEASLAEVDRISPGASARATVIPCCADYDRFEILARDRKEAIRKRLGIQRGALTVGYLGSIGTWYMLDQMLDLFRHIREENPGTKFLLITNDWDQAAEELVIEAGLADARSDILVTPAAPAEVPELLNACDLMLALFRRGYSNIAVSPTKFAEAAACGVPTICNRGVGDMDRLIEQFDAGALIDPTDARSMREAASGAREIAAKGGEALRRRTRTAVGLEAAIGKYRSVYMRTAGLEVVNAREGHRIP